MPLVLAISRQGTHRSTTTAAVVSSQNTAFIRAFSSTVMTCK